MKETVSFGGIRYVRVGGLQSQRRDYPSLFRAVVRLGRRRPAHRGSGLRAAEQVPGWRAAREPPVLPRGDGGIEGGDLSLTEGAVDGRE